MSENRDYVQANQENGVISISEDVIASIASIAVLEVEGVSSIIQPGGLDISELLRKASTKGIKITFEESDVKADIAIGVKYGATLTEVAAKVQEEVAAAIESMTGLRVTAVNVRIGAVAFPKEEDQKVTEEPDGAEK